MVEPHVHAELVTGERLTERLREEVSRATRHRLPLSLLVFRLDSSGAGEKALERATRAAALLARAVVRRDDVVGLLGPGAFAVVANAARDRAEVLAEDITRHIEAVEFTGAAGPVPIELRYALSCLAENKTAADLVEEARAEL